jgi:hypothetical protein
LLVLIGCALLIPILVGDACCDPFTLIRYQIFHWETDTWIEYLPSDPLPPGGDQPGTNLWRYDYTLYNWGTPQSIQQVYVFFNSDNIAMDATWAGDAAPAGWTTAQIGPFDPDFNWKERFRASTSEYYVDAGDSLAGFSVEFTWTSSLLPGNQIYDAVYSGGSEAGVTIHQTEPSAVAPTSWGGIKQLYR